MKCMECFCELSSAELVERHWETCPNLISNVVAAGTIEVGAIMELDEEMPPSSPAPDPSAERLTPSPVPAEMEMLPPHSPAPVEMVPSSPPPCPIDDVERPSPPRNWVPRHLWDHDYGRSAYVPMCNLSLFRVQEV